MKKYEIIIDNFKTILIKEKNGMVSWEINQLNIYFSSNCINSGIKRAKAMIKISKLI